MIARIVAVALVALFAADTPASCGPDSGGNPPAPPGHAFSCGMKVVDDPRLEGGSTIMATLHVDCAPSPKVHNLQLWFEREVGDGGTQWIIQGDITWEHTLPDAVGFDKVATATCKRSRKPIRWRVMASAAGFGPIGKDGLSHSFKFNLPESETKPVSLPCS